jgi:hypothetical protein
MIQKITSRKVDLPSIWLVEDQKDWDELPRGLPRILAPASELSFIRIFLEFQVFIRSCKKTRLPIKWTECLERLGYKSTIKQYGLSSGGTFIGDGSSSGEVVSLNTFIEDQYLVDFDRLSELKILPKWLDDLKSAVETNIIDEVIFDPTLFNKQIGLNVGAATRKTNMKNLLILDVSGSMPDGVVKTITNLAKLMSKKFYADVIITGGKSFIVDYEQVPNKDIIDLARIAGRNNEGEMFRAIVKDPKHYGTVISFGDDDNPGELVCNFKVDTLYSLHTEKSSNNVTGYARCLKPKSVNIVKDWLRTIEL